VTARILIACEFSGTVREAFNSRGYDAWSCDLFPDERGSNRHIRGDVRDVLSDGWDMLIVAHPPCTRLCNSGVRWLTKPPTGRTLDEMWQDLDDGAALFSTLWNAPIARIAVENPIMHRHAKTRIDRYEEPAQSVQPWQFGEWESKRTCLWLRDLPTLVPTYRTYAEAGAALGVADGEKPAARVHRHSGWGNHGVVRARERSRFFPGIAAAMADQWGPLLPMPSNRLAA